MADEKDKTFKFDPRDLIGGPYEDCPKCGEHEYGVLSINHNSCTRRCKKCWRTMDIPLPKLKKKVIYLDQFVFSNIMKMLSADTLGHGRAKKEPLWRELFESLGVLRRLQLIVCPDSHAHYDESLISPFYAELKRTYEHFSTGISFLWPQSIEEKQIFEVFRAWLRNERPLFTFDASRVTSGNLHDWQDRVFITASGDLPGYKRAVEQGRKNVHTGLRNLFGQWQIEKKKFGQVFETEKSSFAKSILEGVERDKIHANKATELLAKFGPIPYSISSYSATMNTPLMMGLEWAARMYVLEQGEYPEDPESRHLNEKVREMVIDFVRSGAMSETPANEISAAMFAALASKAASGQKKLPDQGMATDIRTVSSLLPYCDAMFVDNVCRSLLQDIPKSHKMNYQCRVFSSKSSTEFLEYLREIRSCATAEHIELVKRVYGPKSLEPPKGIYGIGEHKKPR
jgi:hypothetical protein